MLLTLQNIQHDKTKKIKTFSLLQEQNKKPFTIAIDVQHKSATTTTNRQYFLQNTTMTKTEIDIVSPPTKVLKFRNKGN